MVIGINQDAYKVSKANWQIYSGLSSGVGTLNGDGLPSVSFRCAVTISSTTGHTDCIGSVTIDSETLTFTTAGKKITTKVLTALPTVSAANLDCNVLIEALAESGNPIKSEALSEIKTRFMNTQKAYLDSSGAWTQSQALADVSGSSIGLGDVFSMGGYDYDIDRVQAFSDGNGSESYRRLYLTGKRAAPSGRAEVMAELTEEEISIPDIMKKSIYDTDGDSVADTAEGIREVEEFPAAPKKGDMVLKDGELYVCTGT